jgi:hypothetical protein
LGGFELEVLESYEIALPQGFMAWMMVIGNEDRQDRLPAAVGVICASDTNDVETRVLSPQEQQQINNIVQQFITTQVTNIEQVINIINNVTTNGTTPTGPVTPPPPPTNDTGDGGGTTPPPGGGGIGPPRVPGGVGGGILDNTTVAAADTTPPVIYSPSARPGGGILYAYDSPEGTYVSYRTEAVDNVDGTAKFVNNILTQDDVGGAIAMSCNPAPGSTFPVGVTTVQCTAVDRAGNVGTLSFTITVELRPTPPPTEEALVEEEQQPPAAIEEQQPPPVVEEEAPVEEQQPPAEEPPAEDEGAASPPANDEGGG